jgi:ribosomal protein S18 acetylase RimI-like enzyme
MVSLRPARLTDAFSLYRNCFPEQSLKEVQDHLRWCVAQQAKGRVVRLVAEADGKVVANGQLAILHDRGEIGSLVVAAPYRRRGLGTALVQALVAEGRRRQVHTLEISARADAPWIEAWYRRLGFVHHKTHDYPGKEYVTILRMAL